MNPFSTVTDLAQGLAQGEYSSRELTQSYLDRIAKYSALNCYITVTPESALAAADHADTTRAAGNAGPLTGIPLAQKDIFCTKDIVTTCGSKMLANFVAPYDATVVQKLDAAGMVSLGKANMDEFAMGSSNENSAFGVVQNPWGETSEDATTYTVPGGSSGGSAAAVAAGLAPIATGTDTGGSIRQPAAFCGLTGLKPTYGRVSRYGMIAFASSLDQGGPIARSAADAALMLSYMAGFDERDSTSSNRTDKWLSEISQQGLRAPNEPLKIGIPKEYLASLTDEDSALALNEVKRLLQQQGHQIVEVSLPHTNAAIPCYYVIAGAEASTNLSRYDGVRFGHRCEDPKDLLDLYERSRSEGFGDEVKRRILTGTYALSVGYYDAYYLKAQKIRRLISNDFNQAFASVNAILAPTTNGPAFAGGAMTQDPLQMYAQDKFTVPASLAGLPAISIPAGFSHAKPLAVQLISPAFREDLALQLAHSVQASTDWHLQIPSGVSS